MHLSSYMDPTRPGVSVITCTNRPNFREQLFRNYERQQWGNKELIVILNRDSMRMQDYRELASQVGQVKIYRMPEKATLGQCLNYAVQKCRHDIVAKFDDDDYYSPYYLKEAVTALTRNHADLAGKSSYHMYLSGKRLLILRYPQHRERFAAKRISGATLVARKHVFDAVKFERRSTAEVTRFVKACRAKGFHIAATGIYNFAAVRRKNLNSHTWKAVESKLASRNSTTIGPVANYEAFVTKEPGLPTLRIQPETRFLL